MAYERYDVIVIGAAGAVGSAAMWRAAQRGLRVLGLDRFPPGHDRGSSHGRTRIIRQAYFEHADYVPLLLWTYELWAELEQAGAERLFHPTGLLQVGPAEGHVVRGVLESARRHDLYVESLSASECRRRFPAFTIPDDCRGVFEPAAGYLRVERCLVAQANEALRHDAQFKTGVTVTGWKVEPTHVVVSTDQGEYAAERIIVTAGAWAGELLRDLGVPLIVRRKPQFWFEARDESYDAERGCPAYLFETPRGVFYGFPRLDEHGVKVAEHTGGETVADPLAVDRAERAEDVARVREFTRHALPRLTDRLLAHSVCMYTMSPDEHFIVDRHPGSERVVFAAGLSGHGFKFSPVLGEALVDLAISGSTKLPIEFLGLARFAS
jgi:sarcosine oxidase